jgi:CRP-like cAMP-binding protein
MPDNPVRVEFLRKLHLFRGLTDMQLLSVAEAMEEEVCPEPKAVITQGKAGQQNLYFVFSGRVTVTQRQKDKERKLATLMRGDYFGEASLLTNNPPIATVTAEKDAVLLTLSRERFKALLTNISDLKLNFEVMMASRTLARELKFPWLSEDEVIYYLARKHKYLLYQAMVLPALVLLLPLFLLFFAYVYSNLILAGAAGFFLTLDGLWIWWRAVDWSNDYYIVTNQRAVWIEKVVGLYDSRREASMGTILSVNTETEQWGRIFGYGTVVVRTFVGELRMDYVTNPKEAAAMIEEYWLRTRERTRAADGEIMKKAILGKLNPPPPKTPTPPVPPKKEKRPSVFSMLRLYFKDMFKMRIETGGSVIYRKHWFVLFRDTLPSMFTFLVTFFIYPLWWWFQGAPPPLWAGSLLFVAQLFIAGWWFYGYVDWRNDLYQVTPEQIIDVYKVPFGKEDRKAAPLENILSLNFVRSGIIQSIFNYGTVNIQVGGATFDFVDVMDPPSVQQDIVRRKAARDQKKRENETAGERERMAEWLAMYHKTLEELEREKKKPGPNQG